MRTRFHILAIHCVGLSLAAIGAAPADEPTPPAATSTSVPQPPPIATKRSERARAKEKEKEVATPTPAASPTTLTTPPLVATGATPNLDPTPAKTDAETRLKVLEKVADKEMTAAQKTLREVLNERLKWIDEWQKATTSRKTAEKPVPTPETEAAEFKADLERTRAMLDQAAKSSDALLPASFRIASNLIDDAKLKEMDDAIKRAKTFQNDRMNEFEKLRAEPAARTALLNTIQAERDKTHARITALPTRRTEREAALNAANDENSRLIARDQLVNLRWEAAVENERLLAAEAVLSLETRRAANVDLAIEAKTQSLKLAKQTTDVLTNRYRMLAEQQKRDLNREAAKEATLAATADDPVEKFMARRRAELLGLQAQIVEDKKSLSASQSLSLEDQTALANRVEADFANLKQVVKDNRVGGLIALRLNNDFRRISRERAILIRNDLVQSSAANTYYENALTEAELAFFNDARDDRFERDAFIETLPKDRRARADQMLDEIEAKHKQLLGDHRAVLEKLLTRAEGTHQQVTRRLRILDEQYAFVRTNIFWVRDSEPIGPTTLPQARKDAGRLLATFVRLASETLDPMLWSPVSAEFTLATIAAVILPPIIWQTRKRLKARIA